MMMPKYWHMGRNATLLFVLWVLLSGRSEPWLLAVGLLASVAIAWLHEQHPGPPAPTIPVIRFFIYLLWLLYRVIVSNLQTARLILHPKLPIHPRLIRYQSGLRNPTAVTLMANSITLAPGTVTVEASPRELVVHALDEHVAGDLLSGQLERHIAWVFEINKERS